MNVQQFFMLGMKREIPPLLDFPPGPVLNLGCGRHKIEGAINLDYPQWEAERSQIDIPAGEARKWRNVAPWTENMHHAMDDVMVRCPDNAIAGIHAYHFLEHLRDPRKMLREMQRVLMPGGVINICVPHYLGSMAHQDLDHKHNFALDTWSNTLNATFYDKDRLGWKLKIHFNMLMAITERNCAILTQLVKE